MKRTYQLIISLCLPLVLCSQVKAQHTGPYVGAFLGGNYLITSKGSDNQGNLSLKFDPALQESAVVGWDFGPGNPIGEGRVEVEYTHRSNPLTEVSLAGGNVKAGGNVVVDSLLLNLWGVFHNRSPWSPYCGVGLGAARMEASGLKVAGQPLASGTSTVFAYQLGGGIDYALTENVSFDLGYRFMGTLRPRFTEAGGQSMKMDYFSHTAQLGVRFGF